MADTKVSALSALGSIDRTTDLLYIVDASGPTSNKITVNNALGFSGGNPVSTTDTQTIQNKTLDNTTTLTIKDANFTIQDDSDTTKQAKFQASGITAGQTRTFTLPDASTTLVGTDTTQTLTNKTLTSPTINTATIANPTITVDSISEYTAANGVTIDGVKLKDGALATNNSVVTANITDSAVTPAKLQSGTGSGWAWQSWSPTWTNLTVGNGTVTAAYLQIGKTVFFRLKLVFGSTTSISGSVSLTVPVTAIAAYMGAEAGYIGQIKYLDAGTASYAGTVAFGSASSIAIGITNVASTYPSGAAISSTVPFTWGSSDEIHMTGAYEAA